ncbi:MAG: hypothetical protein K2X00_06220 [Nitrospiraceae bacterium]|uniref:hypothetical protein n=1 Tax=Nitrospira cf. moscoviensis SBR1015 TaxID=96242 RepID=UPI000A0E379D|nr:hypothetical protein [Nitrospira cf. moscoviensis SBR1015]MBX9658144.1 hypothetical protein [Nitrospiraceae bacterium]OQW29988.1 MAG: hypothetical protein A4E20_04570 [Nitrospira sp. SG-bin2]
MRLRQYGNCDRAGRRERSDPSHGTAFESDDSNHRQGGANSIVAPATFGGYALAAVVDQSHIVQYLEDLLTAGGRVNLLERQVREDEIGKTAADLKPAIVLRIYRGTFVISMTDVQAETPLQRGNLLVILKPTA